MTPEQRREVAARMNLMALEAAVACAELNLALTSASNAIQTFNAACLRPASKPTQ